MMMKLFLFLVGLMATSSSAYVCKVCGDGWSLETHTATYKDPKNATKTCGELRKDALAGLISEADCPMYPPLLQVACCKQNASPTPAPTVHTPRPSKAQATSPAPTPGRMTDRPTFATTTSSKKESTSVSDAPPAKSTGGGSTSSSSGKAGKAVGGMFAALVVVLVIVIVVKKGRKSTPRTADLAGTSLDPDGSNLNKYSDTPDPSIDSGSGSMDQSEMEEVAVNGEIL